MGVICAYWQAKDKFPQKTRFERSSLEALQTWRNIQLYIYKLQYEYGAFVKNILTY